MIVGVLIVKSIIWSFSLGSGTSGGVLAPLLMMGGALGGVEVVDLPAEGVGFWPLVSMGAILGGTMRSPFTGVVFALELTHDVNMMLPLLVAVTIAHGFTVLMLRRSILTEKVARRGYHLSREYAVDPLEILFAREVMRTDGRRAARRTSPIDWASKRCASIPRRVRSVSIRSSTRLGACSAWSPRVDLQKLVGRLADGRRRAARGDHADRTDGGVPGRAAARNRPSDGRDRAYAIPGRRARIAEAGGHHRARRSAEGARAEPGRRARRERLIRFSIRYRYSPIPRG